MADKAIGDLNFAPGTVDDSNTLFVVQQAGAAYKLSGHEFILALTTILDGHGGISSITGPVSSGLEDTYTINFADQTTTTFTVSNGNGVTAVTQYWAVSSSDSTVPTSWSTTRQTLTDTNKYLWSYLKFTLDSGNLETTKSVVGVYGDTGNAWYVWVRYAGECSGTPPMPASDSDIGTTPDNWMGIYSGTSSTAPTTRSSYSWFEIKGEKGDPGTPSTITTQNVSYQASNSGTVAPSGSWTSTIPTVPQGSFLWTRTQLVFNDGTAVESYSVSRYGIDGSGSVSMVNSISPDGSGNVEITASDIALSNNTSVQENITDLKSDVYKLKGAIIYPTGDTTDRSSEIASKLSTYGYCEFVQGEYYISAPIQLNEGQTIKGAGRLSVIQRTPTSQTYGLFYINNNTNHVTIKDLQLKGSLSSRPSSAPTGQEYGLSITGDGSGVVIENCYFKGFDSYGIYSTAGYSCGTSAGVLISNCTFKFNGTGIFLDAHGEYSDVTNCVFSQNYHGATVIGGNNKFANCGFDTNDTGFVLYDNTTGTNDGHGSCVSCSFNHNTTYAVTVTNIDYGYVFTGCNIYYGDVLIYQSKGIIFSGCDCLGHKTSSDHTDFVVTSCPGYVTVDHCTFTYDPTFTVTSSPYFIKLHCWTHSGSQATTMIPFETLSKTYTTNSYVTESNWSDRIYRVDNLILIQINTQVSSTPGTTFRTIGHVNLPRTLEGMASCTMASQNNVGTLLWVLQQNGDVQIYSNSTATGWYRGCLIAVLSST